jgi:hypothetical protein
LKGRAARQCCAHVRRKRIAPLNKELKNDSMRAIIAALSLFVAACATAPAQAQVQCQPAGFGRAELDALKAADWALADDTQRNALARGLAACLSNPDPTLRDGIAFEALQHWLRARELSTETMLWLADDLETRLAGPEGAGFERPFAALVLSEVARADRIEGYLQAERLARLLDAAIAYFTGVRDYRGFDERQGWRHGVAHGADLLLQLALNPALGRAELTRIRDALAAQLTPEEHFYTYGESERIARPIIFMAQRGVFSEAEWMQWFAQVRSAGDNPYMSQAGLASIHNIRGFLNAVLVGARLTEPDADDVLLPGAEAAYRALP